MTDFPDEEKALYLQPGEILQLDYRTDISKRYADSNCFDRIGKSLRTITWNIERGYKLPEIIAELKDIDADNLCLQEIDSGCSRSQFVDTGIAIAKALGLVYVFQSEFVELGSGEGNTLNDTHGKHGVHGNCIMTRFNVKETASIDHKYQVCVCVKQYLSMIS